MSLHSLTVTCWSFGAQFSSGPRVSSHPFQRQLMVNIVWVDVLQRS